MGFTDGLPCRGLQSVDRESLIMLALSHTASTVEFDLLDSMDATGGLAFTLASTPLIPPDELQLAQDDEIAEEISRNERTKDIWWDENSHARFSLGGSG